LELGIYYQACRVSLVLSHLAWLHPNPFESGCIE